MQVAFHGAVQEVTGSMHLVSSKDDNILMDCGMFQGRRKDSELKNKSLPFDPGMITNIVLSHAHIDHSGRIPLLVKEGFAGRVISTRATADACMYMLSDSAHIQESDADYLNYKTTRTALKQMRPSIRKKKYGIDKEADIKGFLKKGGHKLDSNAINKMIDRLNLEKIDPLYTQADALDALENFDGFPYRFPVSVGSHTTCTLYDAGHILGSAMSILQSQENGRPYTVAFTGDIGRFDKPIICDPTLEFADEHRSVDLLIIESTYGDRLHTPVKDLKPELKQVLIETHQRKGSVLIPSFAFGRTQELLYVLHELYAEGDVPQFPVYVDSPLATNLTRVFAEHPEVYDEETHDTFLENGMNPFNFDQIHFVNSVEESMALNRDLKPHIVLSASGMCEAGRILHHLRHKIHNPNNTVLIVGFMAQNTLGRRILEEGIEYEKTGRKGDPPMVKFFNKEYPLKARVINIGGFSAHGDKTEMMRFVKDSNLDIKKIAIVHGEPDQSRAFAENLRSEGFPVIVPKRGETVKV